MANNDSNNLKYLNELLQSKSVNEVVKEIIETVKTRDEGILEEIIFELLVNLLDRNYAITSDELLDLHKLASEIYQSENYGDEIVLTDTADEFFNKFLIEAFEQGIINYCMINRWINLLMAIIEHENIPSASSFKGAAIHLLSLFLNPLARIYQTQGDENIEDDNDSDILSSLHRILNVLPEGFKLKKLSQIIASKFIEAMENFHQIFITDTSNFLGSYMKLLLVESNTLHTSALVSLKTLCSIDDIRGKLIEFLFDDTTTESFMQVLSEMTSRRGLKVEIMQLLIAMINLQDSGEFIDEEMRIDLYLNIFTGQKKIVSGIIALMMALDENFWIVIIKLLNRYVTSDIDWDHFFDMISSFDEIPCKTETFTKIILENLNNPEISQRAAAILIEWLKYNQDEHKTMLEALDVILLALVQHEKTFITLIELFTVVDIKFFGEFYKEHTDKLISLINCLTQAYDVFESPVSLYNVVIALKTITNLSPDYVTKGLRSIWEKYYDDLLNGYRNENSVELCRLPLTKLSILLENRCWNILKMSSLEVTIWDIVETLNDAGDELLPVLVRFYTNVLKQIWTRLLLGKSIPFSDEFIKTKVTDFFESITDFLEKPDLNLETSSNLLCSFMDIAVMFQPSMRAQYSHTVFMKLMIPLGKKRVQWIAHLVEKTVFGSNSNEGTNSREMVLLSWIAFHRNYINLPSSTASEKIIRFYRIKGQFKSEIEILMNDIIKNEHTFVQIIVFATLNLSNMEDSIAFRSFYQAIDEFLTKKYKDETKKLAMKTSICAQLLSRLKNHIELKENHLNADRLLVLDFVAIIIKNMESSLKQKLLNFIAPDLELRLNDIENAHLKSFKEILVK